MEEHHPVLQVFLLGAFTLELSDGTRSVIDTLLGRSHSTILFKLLLLHPERRATRDSLVGAIWPGHSYTSIGGSLNVAKSVLNKKFEELCGHTLLPRAGGNPPGYSLVGQALLWTDLDACEQFIRQAVSTKEAAEALSQWKAAYALMQRGELLAGDMTAYWYPAHLVQDRIKKLSRQHTQCVLRIADLSLECGDLNRALSVLTAETETDPANEDVVFHLMNLLANLGRSSEALAHYSRLEAAHLERNTEPREETKALTHQLRSSSMSNLVTGAYRQEVRLNETGVSISSFAHVIQLPHTQQPALLETVSGAQGTFVPSESGILAPIINAIPMLPIETASLDVATWFGARVNDLKAIGAFWHGPTITCQQQQAFIHVELEKWGAMTDQSNHNISEYHITRRTALATLATLSTSLLTKMQFGPLMTLVIEEFLAESTTSIVACWHLLRGDGLATVEHALPKYLPLLVSLIKQFPSYKQKASYLASQGFLLLSLVALHRLRFLERVTFCKQAVEFASESGDRTLLVTSLTHLGDAFFTNGQRTEMLHTYQQAEYYGESTEISAFLRSKVLGELAHAYAQQGKSQEVFRCLGEAHTIFTEESSDTPVFLSTDYGLFQLILHTGLSTLDLGNYEDIQDNPGRAQEHYRDATSKLNQIEHLSQTIIVPERIRVEIVNQRALAAAKAGNLDEFEQYLIEGANGARSLASEKRRQEAIANWKIAREQWPHEKRVLELAEVLF